MSNEETLEEKFAKGESCSVDPGIGSLLSDEEVEELIDQSEAEDQKKESGDVLTQSELEEILGTMSSSSGWSETSKETSKKDRLFTDMWYFLVNLREFWPSLRLERIRNDSEFKEKLACKQQIEEVWDKLINTASEFVYSESDASRYQ